jgi:hypothetical protein
MHITNLKKEIPEAAGGEEIVGICIEKDDYYFGGNERVPEDKRGIVLPASEALDLLDYDFDSGFGGRECHAFYAWTASRIIFLHEYDGSTSVCWIPRHPIDCSPSTCGS